MGFGRENGCAIAARTLLSTEFLEGIRSGLILIVPVVGLFVGKDVLYYCFLPSQFVVLLVLPVVSILGCSVASPRLSEQSTEIQAKR